MCLLCIKWNSEIVIITQMILVILVSMSHKMWNGVRMTNEVNNFEAKTYTCIFLQ